jgi:hypothetical protein
VAGEAVMVLIKISTLKWSNSVSVAKINKDAIVRATEFVQLREIVI